MLNMLLLQFNLLLKSVRNRRKAPPRWKGGITNDKKYFSENMAEKVVTTQVGLPYSYYDETIAA